MPEPTEQAGTDSQPRRERRRRKDSNEPPERVQSVSIRIVTNRREIEKDFRSLRDLISWLSDMQPKHPALRMLKTYGLDALEVFEGLAALKNIAERHSK